MPRRVSRQATPVITSPSGAEQRNFEDLTIHYAIPESTDRPVQFSNVASITQDGAMAYLTFAQAIPPIISSPEQESRLRRGRALDAGVVAQVVMPIPAFFQLVDAINSQANHIRDVLEQATADAVASRLGPSSTETIAEDVVGEDAK